MTTLSELLQHRQDLLERRDRLSEARQSLSDVDRAIDSVEGTAFPLLLDVLAEHQQLRARVAQLADRRPDGDQVVRATQSPIPGVGLGSLTRTFVEQHAIRALLGTDEG